MVRATNCILSTDRLQLSDISIGKNIPKRRLLQLVFGIEAGNKWERVEERIEDAIDGTKTCSSCGHFLEACHRNPHHCDSRRGVVDTLRANAIVPEKFLDYPMTPLILATYKEFGGWARYLFPKRAFNVYVDTMNTERSSNYARLAN